MYTNPDVLLNKRDEMMTCICEVNPDIIAMVEIYLKWVKREIETCELQIDDYTFYVNEAPKRGCIVMSRTVWCHLYIQYQVQIMKK